MPGLTLYVRHLLCNKRLAFYNKKKIFFFSSKLLNYSVPDLLAHFRTEADVDETIEK